MTTGFDFISSSGLQREENNGAHEKYDSLVLPTKMFQIHNT